MYWTTVKVMVIFIGGFLVKRASAKDNNTKESEEIPVKLEGKRESEIANSHNIDSLSMLIFTNLLIFTVLMTWLFKIRRFRCFHETGVATVFGIVVGAVIKYNRFHDTYNNSITVENCNNLSVAPEVLKVNINGTFYSYSFKGIIYRDDDAHENELEARSTFNPEIFFHVLLPPIIFSAGYNMKKRYFFRNLGAILTYAFIGTIISTFSTGAMVYGYNVYMGVPESFDFTECLLFGAMIAATDPITVLAIVTDLQVDVDLYALIFGESIFNDAVAIVLYRAVENYLAYQPIAKREFDLYSFLWALNSFFSIFFGSLLIGTGVACTNALVTKLTKIGSFPILETALFFVMSYSSFLAAEVVNWSGIVALLFCGVTQQHYTYKNLSEASRTRTIQTFELLNFLSENFIFSYIGISLFTFTTHIWDFRFIAWSFLAITVGRILNIYSLSFFLNLGRSGNISWNFQHMMMFSGLRGAIAFALAVRNTVSMPRQMMLTATLSIVLVSVILIGGATTPVLKLLQIRTGVDEHQEELKARRLSLIDINDPTVSTPEERREKKQYESAWLVRVWSNFDNKYLKPIFTEEHES
jgi:sodium/hydrogen exchanger-like protein 6/7